MQYRFEMTYGEKDFVGYMAAYLKRHAGEKKSSPLLRNIVRLIGALAVGFGIANIMKLLNGGGTFGKWLLYTLVVLTGLLVFFSRDVRFSGKMLWKRYSGKGSREVFVFGPSDFKEHTGSQDSHYKYSSIIDIYEDDSRFYLFTSSTSAHIIIKSGTSKNPEGFRSFIEGKTNLKAKAVQ